MRIWVLVISGLVGALCRCWFLHPSSVDEEFGYGVFTSYGHGIRDWDTVEIELDGEIWRFSGKDEISSFRDAMAATRLEGSYSVGLSRERGEIRISVGERTEVVSLVETPFRTDLLHVCVRSERCFGFKSSLIRFEESYRVQ